MSRIKYLLSWAAQLPNLLTLLRLVSGLAFPFCNQTWRLILLVYAGVSDAIDGEIGRRLSATSDFGKIVDPIADKVVIISVAFTLVWDGTLSWWQLLLVASRDLAVMGISITAWALGCWAKMLTSPLIIGKLATGVQFLFLTAAVAVPNLIPILLAPVALIVGVATAAYLYDAFDQIRHVRNHSFPDRTNRAPTTKL